jgi:predicted MFS family arabinose efflux permease
MNSRRRPIQPSTDGGTSARSPTGVLLRRADFLLLWAARLISQTGDWTLLVGLPFFVYRLTGSTLSTGATVTAGMLPRILVGSIAGVFVDRWERRRTMILANVALGIAILPLLLVDTPRRLWIVYAVAFTEASLQQFAISAETAFLPRLVGETHLVAANALNAQSNQVARLFGSAAGGAAVATWGLRGVALADAASFIIAAGMVALISTSGRVSRAAGSRGGAWRGWSRFWADWVAGVRLVVRGTRGRALLSVAAITGVGEGVFITLIAPFVSDVLHGDARDYGLFFSIQAIGGIAGGLVVAAVGGRFRPGRMLGLASVAFGVTDLAIFVYPLFLPGVGPALALVAAAGLPAAGFYAGYVTLQQTSASDEYRGRMLGAFATTTALAMVLGTVAAGFLGDPVGIVPVLATQGGTYVAAGILVLVSPLAKDERGAPDASQSV